MSEELAKKEERNPSSEAMIEFIDVHKWFGEFHVLQGIDLTVQKQERIVICGPDRKSVV
jgi:general L-amino acid transport system ATP-binding protein